MASPRPSSTRAIASGFRQIAAARALAGPGIRVLAAAAGIASCTLHRLENCGVIRVSAALSPRPARRLGAECRRQL
jgi:hypothetical protein